MKVAELTGGMLDLWVARAEGKCYTVQPKIWGMAGINDLGRLSIAKGSWDCAKYFEPSSNWAHGGPIIERERISITERGNDGWIADAPGAWCVDGQTPLQAAMRAYVIAKHGEEVPEGI